MFLHQLSLGLEKIILLP